MLDERAQGADLHGGLAGDAFVLREGPTDLGLRVLLGGASCETDKTNRAVNETE